MAVAWVRRLRGADRARRRPGPGQEHGHAPPGGPADDRPADAGADHRLPAGRVAVHRGGGSSGTTAPPAGVLLASKHPHDPGRRVLAVVKTNLGLRPLSQTYAVNGAAAAAVRWDEACEIWADDLLGGLVQLA